MTFGVSAVAARDVSSGGIAVGIDRSLILEGDRVTHPAVNAVITVGAEASDARAITVQLKDANGGKISEVTHIELVLFLNAGGTDFAATGGSTGIAIGASGKLLAVVAKKLFRAQTTAAGLLALTWTDTGTEAAFLGVRLPNGNIIISSALTNA
jgi:hypothetical protein